MDTALTSPVNVQRSPTLTFSPRSTPFTLISPTISHPDNSTLPPPADNMSSSEPSSPITAPESPVMPEPASVEPAAPPSNSNAAAITVDDPSLRRALNELAEAHEQLSQIRAQLLEVQSQNAEIRARQAEIRARQAQIPESANDESGVRTSPADVGLGIQDPPTEPQNASSDPQDTPSSDASTFHEEQISTDTGPGLTADFDEDDTEADPSQTNVEEATEEAGTAEDSVPSTDAPVVPVSLTAPEETSDPSPDADAAAELPEWVDIDEDTSVPDEEELKEIEASNDISARDVKHHEDSFYADAPEDPEQQPLQKMRLTWVIKGVRGTKEKPNRARIMNSPAVLVGGFYWYLKFFPRGNNSSALSAYVRCSRKEPKPDEEVPENTFSVVYGAPDADLGELKPAVDMSIPATAASAEKDSTRKQEESTIRDNSSKKTSEDQVLPHDEPANASADTQENAAAVEDEQEDSEDWRVSAQIGIVIYNPEEPRTKFSMATCHQFNKHNDDWGWTHFHGPWSEIHKRRQGQRQALLRNDTLAIDAYIRILNDPSQALWWHHCSAEEQWDSVSLTGYPAMGTKLYHSPAVAGITAWLLLSPFRKIFQSLDTEAYRKNPRIRPQSLCSQLQMILYLMRKQRKDEKFVSLDAIVEIMDKLDESGTDVVTFWEGFRRSLELELETNPSAVDRLSDIFDARPSPEGKSIPVSPLRIPAENVSCVQTGIEQVFAQASVKQYFPKFLTVEIERQKFDTVIREWKILYDRVQLSEELDLSQWSADPGTSKYTLYGFVVHADERSSGKFYSILRPNGPDTKWLAFEDGTSNQVVSYTKHRLQEFEGLGGDAPKENKATRQTAYLVMYIRTDLLKEFLPGALEPSDLSPWLTNCPQVRDFVETKDVQVYEEDTRLDIKLEIYSSQRIKDRRGLIDVQDLKSLGGSDHANPPQHLAVPAETTYQELRHKLAKWNDIDNVEKIRLWTMQPPSPGAPLNLSFNRVSRLRKQLWERDSATPNLCLWMHVLETDDEVKSFGEPEPAPNNDVFDRTTVESRSLDLDIREVSDPAVDVATEQDSTSNELDDTIPAPESTAHTSEVAATAEELVENEGVNIEDTTQAPAVVNVVASESANTDEPPTGDDAAEDSARTPTANTDVVANAIPDEISAVAQIPSERDGQMQAQDLLLSSPAPVDAAFSQTTPEAPPSVDVSAEDESLIAALIAQDLESLDDLVQESTEEVVAPTVDANAADLPDENSAVNPEAAPRVDSAVGLLESEQPAPVSTEAAPPTAAAETPNDDAQSDSSDDEAIMTIRPVPFYYGFIQLFDAQAQDFIMQGDFFAQPADNVKDFLRKQLGYTEEREFLVWRRGSAYRLTSVQPSSTFEDIRDESVCRHDGFVLVVGDVLSESAKSSLTAISSFRSPEPLSHYLWFSARKHPVKAHTGEITTSSFGPDYYSGHLLKGLYSGLGTHITSTGHSYTGPFLAGTRSTSNEHTEGTCVYSNGDTYTGGWANNERHGQGVFVEKRTGNRYVGGYQEGKRWGKGTTYWEVADEEGEMCQICYGEGVDALFYDCGHVCACVECAKQVEVCPICRKSVKQVVKIWKA